MRSLEEKGMRCLEQRSSLKKVGGENREYRATATMNESPRSAKQQQRMQVERERAAVKQ